MKKRLFPALLLLALLLSVSARAENLLQNSSFDDGSAHWETEMWIADGGVTLAEWTPDGMDGGGLFIENRSANDARFVQTVRVEPETVYLLSGYVKTDGRIPDGGAGVSVIGYTNARAHVADTRGKWEQVSLYFRTLPGQTQATVAARVGFYSGDVAGSARFDELSLTEVSVVPDGVVPVTLGNGDAQEASFEEGAPTTPWASFAVPAAAALVLLLLALHHRRADARAPFERPERTPPVRVTRRELFCLLALMAAYAAVAF